MRVDFNQPQTESDSQANLAVMEGFRSGLHTPLFFIAQHQLNDLLLFSSLQQITLSYWSQGILKWLSKT